MLVPRVRDWAGDAASRGALERIAADPAVEEIVERAKGIDVRLADEWIEARGEALEPGVDVGANRDLAAGERYAVYFWGANTTKALHVGHLRNLALGNAIAAGLRAGGARVENRSLICDVGRSMGEAMAGVVASGRADDDLATENGNGEKSDHFVGLCYAEYVKSGRDDLGDDGAEDSVARESSVYDDKADELMMRVLAGDQRALELWSKTRAWVISGQRKTLSRLGVPFDKVIFESDFLPEVAELANLGLADGTLRRRQDGMLIYPTEREELEEMPLVRADGLPTQHMRALAYWAAAPELDDFTSLQVCGTEWVAHVTCRRQLLDALAAARPNGHANPVINGNGAGGPPTHDVFHGMVARTGEAVSSSKAGALLIDDLVEWAEDQLLTDPELAAVRAAHPQPDRIAARLVVAWFLLQPTAKRIEFEPELLFEPERSLGWDIVRAQAARNLVPVGAGVGGGSASAGAEDPDYRFAVVQSELFRRHLGSVVSDLDPLPLARYVSHFARWHAAGDHSPRVDAVVQAVLDEGVRGLGLEAV
jgi:arginyl-tRNA synthetase